MTCYSYRLKLFGRLLCVSAARCSRAFSFLVFHALDLLRPLLSVRCIDTHSVDVAAGMVLARCCQTQDRVHASGCACGL